MAIAFDSSSSKTDFSTGFPTSLTISHTTSGSNRFLVVMAWCSADDDITGVTYDGVSMTRQIGQGRISGGSNFVELYTLVAPTTGTNNVVISYNGDSEFVMGVVHSYTGVAQTSPVEDTASKSNDTSPTTISVTPTTDNSWAVSFAGRQRDWTLDSGGIERENLSSMTSADSNAAISPAAQHDFTWSTGSPAQDLFSALAFKPFVEETRRIFNIS